ncbi:MAG: SUMF1/EgtB/PvdO family nonheme iron enzyme [Chthoniobacter sp.]|uniref:formylglycine-generating enzyme family protein n=1 Tax=Chthoniobacter sp. TaxID=2510640 RepID=UPI0032A4057D
MALPNPIPDNPLRWDGWKNYNSDDLYARLCLSYESNPSPDQIEENCRQLAVWWQKKLPLKNQPSNPLSQLLRAGLDEAPAYLAEARTKLLDPETRSQFDQMLHSQIVLEALGEFKKLLAFALGENKLREEDENRLYERGRGLGLTRSDMQATVDEELTRVGAERVAATMFVAPPTAVAAPTAGVGGGTAMVMPAGMEGTDAFSEFRRMLRLSKLCIDGDEMTDDQRDAMCNMGESLGLTGGEAEDLIDEYLEEMSGMPPTPLAPAARTGVATAPVARPVPAVAKPAPAPAPVKKTVSAASIVASARDAINTSPLGRAQERLKYPAYTNPTGIEMLLVSSGTFHMGSTERDAGPTEQPITLVTLSCFYLSRFPITNAQYEKFDPTHNNKRAPGAGDNHPVVYVNSKDAEKFCQWLTSKEGKKYRLPTEPEWEYAARGMDGRIFPWGERLDAGNLANFADKQTNFAWRDTVIDDGFPESSPVGSFPRGASPFGIEDMAGNVFEWCLDYFENYKGKERVNPRGPISGPKRVYRGGSWKSRAANLRTTARNHNLPEYSSNDVGFRVLCECEA